MKTIAMLLLALTGCLVLPKSSTTTRDLGTERGSIVPGAVESVSLHAALVGSSVEVSATAQRACTQDVYRVIEARVEKHARYKQPGARSALPAALVALATLPVSALVTGLVVLADGDGDATRSRKRVSTENLACTTTAGQQPIAVRMPSGTLFTDLTGEDGVLRVRIPDSEPYRGVVKIEGGNTSTELTYARESPAITLVRDTVLACGVLHDLRGAVKVELAVDASGHASHIGLDAGDGSFAACVTEGVKRARFSEAQRSTHLVLPLQLPG